MGYPNFGKLPYLTSASALAGDGPEQWIRLDCKLSCRVWRTLLFMASIFYLNSCPNLCGPTKIHEGTFMSDCTSAAAHALVASTPSCYVLSAQFTSFNQSVRIVDGRSRCTFISFIGKLYCTALRTQNTRLLGPKTILYKAFGLF